MAARDTVRNTVYGDNNTTVQATNIYGDVNIGQKNDHDAVKAYLHSIAFPECCMKGQGVERVEGTGGWIYANEVYRRWEAEGGILWVKGRTGSGKTMLMQRIVEEAEEAQNGNGDELILLYFFFHGESSELQQSVSGMYRALQYQLIEMRPDLAGDFLKKGLSSSRVASVQKTPTDTALREQLISSINRLVSSGSKIRIFLDALDQGKAGTTSTALKWCKAITKDAGKLVGVCFSTPPQSDRPGIDLSIDIEQYNQSDMTAFVDSYFEGVEDISDIGSVKQHLLSRAGSVFKWLDVAASQALKLVDDGETRMGYILESIDACPTSLSKAYKRAMDNILEKEVAMAFRLFEWVVLPMQPLALHDLRYALHLETGKQYRSLADLRSRREFLFHDDEELKRLAQRVSGRLLKPCRVVYLEPKTFDVPNKLGHTVHIHAPHMVEIVTIDYVKHTYSALTFDHESVSHFVRTTGLQMLWSRLNRGTEVSLADMHFSLATRCLAFMRVEEAKKYASAKTIVVDSESEELGIIATSGVQDLEQQQPPFLMYAALEWGEQVKLAQANGMSSEAVVSAFAALEKTDWDLVCTLWRIVTSGCSSRYHQGASFLHVACCMEFTEIVQTVFRPSQGILDASHRAKTFVDKCQKGLEARTINGQTPLSLAAELGYLALVKVLIENGANIEAQNRRGLTPAHLAARRGHVNTIKLLRCLKANVLDAKSRDGSTVLTHACAGGDLETVKFLTQHCNAIVHTKSVGASTLDLPYPLVNTPLTNAFIGGSEEMLEVLLTSPNIDAKFGAGLHSICWSLGPRGEELNNRPPLARKLAMLVCSGKLALNEKLMETGSTPLHVAADFDSSYFTALLLDTKSADIHARDAAGHTPLMRAIVMKTHRNVQAFIDSAAETLDDKWGAEKAGEMDMLEISISVGSLEIFELLVDTGHFNLSQPIYIARCVHAMQGQPRERIPERRAIFDILSRHYRPGTG